MVAKVVVESFAGRFTRGATVEIDGMKIVRVEEATFDADKGIFTLRFSPDEVFFVQKKKDDQDK